MTKKLSMTKFQRRADDVRRKFEDEMKALEAAESKEIARRIDPVVSKITKVVEEEVRKFLLERPENLEAYVFRKREVSREIREVLERVLSAENDEAGGSDGDSVRTGIAPETGDNDVSGDGGLSDDPEGVWSEGGPATDGGALADEQPSGNGYGGGFRAFGNS